ncbi:hypothetical protein Leryth_007543 [Lithospermum erythrorhizon]|nr:hypothetical protein Leryth_007543 [Lithospermum erythrorhizon]
MLCLHPKPYYILLFFIILLPSPEFISAAVVTLNSIEIFKTHEWFSSTPKVYFQCKGENKTFLPDVKRKHVTYMFRGEESWQPLTELLNRKCKRCGIYEQDPIKSDDVFDEWELCASDFNISDGQYVHLNKKEFNATFLCAECSDLVTDQNSDSKKSPSSENAGKGMHWTLIVVISVLVSSLFILGMVMGIKFYQKRRRQKEQARFLKLFEEGDDIEDELGLGPLNSPL